VSEAVFRCIIDLNPLPWRVPPFSVGRGKGGGRFVVAGRDQELHSYQEAIREHLTSINAPMMEPPYRILLAFSRSTAAHMVESGRKAKGNNADSTNLQKAAEDALQGVVISNDTHVRSITSMIVDQSDEAPPFIALEVRGGYEDLQTPRWVWEAYGDRKNSHTEAVVSDGNEWPPRS
jgi:Holliday junction resolvase RusA-like endonuclease